MTPDQRAISKMDRRKAASLGEVLRACNDVQAIVALEIERLSALSPTLEHDLDPQTTPKETVPSRTVSLRTNLERASHSLESMRLGLEIEVRERAMLGHRFAAAVEQESAARDASLHDALTGMPNRVLFRDHLQHGIAQATRHDRIFALMFVDLDNFKKINDEYGHSTGDRALQITAHRLQTITRSDDLVSRHGGDEFLYLATDIHEESNIPTIAEKIIAAVQTPFQVGGEGNDVSISMQASIGIAVFPRHGGDADALVRIADTAMYCAKRNRSGYAFAP